MRNVFCPIFLMFLLVSCAGPDSPIANASTKYAEFFRIEDSTTIVILSPFDDSSDTLIVSEPFKRVICMSSSHVAFFDALGADSIIAAVSGLSYISSPELRQRSDVYDIGYEPELDYERILSLKPDVLLSYSISSLEPAFVSKLKSLGVRVITISEHYESHPLARAEYIRLFGVLCGRTSMADSLFDSLQERYLSLCESVNREEKLKVLVNMPYDNQWFIPGEDNYMSRLIQDAGGVILGSKKNSRSSGIISVEQAYLLSKEADVWLNPGYVSSKRELCAANPLFDKFNIDRIYNNTLRLNAEGGNDFFESGNVCPDLILEDLIAIFNEEDSLFHYYLKVD